MPRFPLIHEESVLGQNGVVADIGLFPLGVVLLPGERVSLHIFEPRYKELINECIEAESPFGVVLLNSGGAEDVGTKAEVVEVLERFEDGRMNIIVKGSDRFELLEIRADRSFLTAHIDLLVDDTPLPPEAEYEACLVEYRRVMRAAGLDLDEPVPDYFGLAFHIASRLHVGNEIKQELLEMQSESLRLARVKEFLEVSVAAVRSQMIELKARSNGQVSPIGRLGSP